MEVDLDNKEGISNSVIGAVMKQVVVFRVHMGTNANLNIHCAIQDMKIDSTGRYRNSGWFSKSFFKRSILRTILNCMHTL